jgi:hypothetical protein
MILKYVIKNNSDGDLPIEPGEAWQFVCRCDDTHDAYVQMEKVKMSARQFGHDIMNVYLDGARFDPRSWWTQEAHADNFHYDDSVAISSVRDETRN